VLILAIETSTRQVGVALAETGGAPGDDAGVRVLASVTTARESRHAESLAPAVSYVCATAGVTPARLGALVVGLGPGLFTGLRVGVATAQAMALALGVPGVGVSSLDVVAHGLAVVDRPVVVAMDARRGELFWAPYREGGPRGLRREGPDRADGPHRVAAAAAELAGSVGSGPGVVVVGDGPGRYPECFEALAARADVAILGGTAGLPSPVAAVELGAFALAEGRGGPPSALVPIYVREPDAVRWPGASAAAGSPTGASGPGPAISAALRRSA
jgi:tRNA threonylcarbamoyladenosine biosynthesis protein TsaB